MEITRVLKEYNDFISTYITDVDVYIGQSVSADNKHINIYPANYSFTYEQEYCNLILEAALPGEELVNGTEFADKISKIIELDNLNDIRLNSYDLEFFWNEEIAGVITAFSIRLQIHGCRKYDN